MLHVYAGEFPSDAVYVLGTPESLMRLQKAIDLALSSGEVHSEFRTKDESLYGVFIRRVDDVKELDRIMLPYASASGDVPGLHPTHYGDDFQRSKEDMP